MATLLHLSKQGILFRYDPQLPFREQEGRLFFGSEDLKSWIETTLPGMGSTWNIESSPLEQVDALLAIFCAGKMLTYGHAFKPITYIEDGIWELKTADIRIFGWFPQKDCFVGVVANAKDFIQLHRLYHGLAGEVFRFRENLNLDEPKFVPGDNPHDVISNFAFPEPPRSR